MNLQPGKFHAVILSIVAALLGPQSALAQSSAQPPEPGKISLVGAMPAELKVKRAKTGHLLVSPQIDGQNAGWFIFDTGAGMSCVDKTVVERLKLPDAGEASAKGTGGTQSTRLRKIKTLALGPVLIEDSTVVELNLKPIALAMGEQIDGVIGYECFLAGVFEIDLEAGKITVHDPAQHKLPSDQQWQPLTLTGRRPHVTGKIESNEPGTFLLDIGANSSVTVNAPTVKRFNLLEGRETRATMSGGVGGIHAARAGALANVTICGQQVSDVPAVFTQSDKGAAAEDDVQGSIGVGLLKRFLLLLDYRNQTIALVPRA